MIKSAFSPPDIDQATIDFYVAKARRERSLFLTDLVKTLFTAPERKPSAAKSGVTA